MNAKEDISLPLWSRTSLKPWAFQWKNSWASTTGSQRSKRGPKSQLERQLEAIATLPRNQQQKILAVVEAMIAHHATR
jgi:hypothetical protein